MKISKKLLDNIQRFENGYVLVTLYSLLKITMNLQ